jgi:hypothetical protein
VLKVFRVLKVMRVLLAQFQALRVPKVFRGPLEVVLGQYL